MNNSLKRRHDPSSSETFKTTQNQLEKQNPNFNQEVQILNSHKYSDGKKLQNIVAKGLFHKTPPKKVPIVEDT